MTENVICKTYPPGGATDRPLFILPDADKFVNSYNYLANLLCVDVTGVRRLYASYLNILLQFSPPPQ